MLLLLKGAAPRGQTPQERHLQFHPDGSIEGSGSHEGTVKGVVTRPDVEWTEHYSWGSMLVTWMSLLGAWNHPWSLLSIWSLVGGCYPRK